MDSEADSEKASEGKVAESDEDGESEDSDDSQEEGKRAFSRYSVFYLSSDFSWICFRKAITLEYPTHPTVLGLGLGLG